MVLVTEVAIGVSVVGYFVSPHITRLMEIARSCAASKYKLSWCMKKKLKKLAKELKEIRSFLNPASMSFVNDQTWLERLWRLKDAIHDAEEILDFFESDVLELKAAKKLKKNHMQCCGSSSSSRKSTFRSCIGTEKGPSLGQLSKLLKNLVELRERARELSQGRAVLSRISRDDMGPKPVRDKKLFFGYTNEYEQLVSMLRDSNTDKKLIAIIGHGGMGKTELARQAFNDVRSEFDPPIWVPAYGKNTQLDLLAEIWKSAGRAEPGMNIPGLQEKLTTLLTSKKCLLVLDDVWCDEKAINENERKDVMRFFTEIVGVGSRIVMTTRAKICSTTLSADETIVLNGIGLKEVTLLLNHTAKLAADDSRIQLLLNEQLPKLMGSPLAAIEIGDELIKHKEQAAGHSSWCCEILNDIENHMGSVFVGHLFTFQHLPPHLQRCLAFCGIFPRSWKFQAEKLTKMWVAHGFVEEEDTSCRPDCGKKSMEDIASGYLQSLVDRSLFQLEEACGSSSMGTEQRDKQTYYVIHEQIHWMIQLASANNCVRISRDSTASRSGCTAKPSIPATVRHLSVTSGCLDQLKEYAIRLGSLRTLLVLKEKGDGKDPASLISAILEQFKGVRVLDLTETGLTELPENIGKLKHVRYLGLPGTISSNLCDQVTKLLFLQTLAVGDKSNTEKKRECITNISGIGRLVKLRESIEFKVMRASEKEGHGVSELAGMNSLGETLTIKGLDAISSKEEAEEAQLGRKVSVQILKLEWGAPDLRQFADGPSSRTSEIAAADPAVAVLEGLQPHGNIQDLRITRYPGETSPTWFSGLQKLTRLYLRNCRRLQALPALGALPCLELLDIKELTAVVKINGDFCGDGAFLKLKKIVLDDMEKLVAWDDMPKHAFSVLREVRIKDCPRLSSLSGLGCCGGPIDLRVQGCPAITRVNQLPANFKDGGNSTCKFY